MPEYKMKNLLSYDLALLTATNDREAIGKGGEVYRRVLDDVMVGEVIEMVLLEGERVVKKYPAVKKTSLHLRTSDLW